MNTKWIYALFGLVVFASVVFAVTGANVGTETERGRWNFDPTTTVATEGGNVSGVNVSTDMLTERWAAFYGKNTSNNTLVNNTARNSNHGYRFEISENNSFIDNTAEENVAMGFILYNQSNYNKLINNTAHNNTDHGFLAILNSSYNVLHNNTASFNKHGVNIVNNSNYNNITNNTIYNSSENGIFVIFFNSNNRIENNTVYNSTSNGIACLFSGNNAILNNTVYDNPNGIMAGSSPNTNISNNTAFNNTNNGIGILNSSNCNIFNNTAHTNSQGILIFSDSSNNNVTSNEAHNNIFTGFGVGNNSDNNSLALNRANNNSIVGFYVDGGSGNNFTSNNASLNNLSGIFVVNSDNTIIDPSYFCNNLGNGITINSSNNTLIDDSVACNNSKNGIEINHSINTTINRSLVYNNSYGVRMSNATNNNFTNNNITNNTNNGVRFDSATSASTLLSNYVCFNGLDVNNQGSNNNGSLDSCDSFLGWSENGHLGCEYACTDFWHRFFGNINGTIILTDVAGANYVYSWNATGFSVYFTDYDSTIDWLQLQAIGRNTSNQTSSSDFEELDVAFNGTGVTDNINTTYSTDGTLPKVTDNYTVFQRPIDYIPLANSSPYNTTFQTGILWDMSDGGTEFTNTINQSTVWMVQVNTSTPDTYGTYDYLISVPYTLATYEPNNDLVAIYVELT